MKFDPANIEEAKILFKEWTAADRLEEVTCRPVINGKRVPRSEEVFHFLFYAENISEPAGYVSYFDINERNRSCEFGYCINPKFRNKGYGKTMLTEFITHMFTNTNLTKLYCQTASFNKPSVKMLESLGFKRDGILREHHELDGKFYDDYVYSVLRPEWKVR